MFVHLYKQRGGTVKTRRKVARGKKEKAWSLNPETVWKKSKCGNSKGRKGLTHSPTVGRTRPQKKKYPPHPRKQNKLKELGPPNASGKQRRGKKKKGQRTTYQDKETPVGKKKKNRGRNCRTVGWSPPGAGACPEEKNLRTEGKQIRGN